MPVIESSPETPVQRAYRLWVEKNPGYNTARRLAVEADIGESHVYQILNGSVATPTVETANRIAKVLGSTCEECWPTKAEATQ